MVSPTFYNPSASYTLGTEAIVCNCGALAPSFHTREAKVRIAFVVMIWTSFITPLHPYR